MNADERQQRNQEILSMRERDFTLATSSLGLDGLRFHDLRHTAVALAISQGAHPKALQERMATAR